MANLTLDVEFAGTAPKRQRSWAYSGFSSTAHVVRPITKLHDKLVAELQDDPARHKYLAPFIERVENDLRGLIS